MANSGLLWIVRLVLAVGIVFLIIFVSSLIYYGGIRLIRADAISEYVFPTLFIGTGSYSFYTIARGLVRKRMNYLDNLVESWRWFMLNGRKRVALTLFLLGIVTILFTTGRQTFVDDFLFIPKIVYPQILLSIFFFPITALETIIFPYSVFARVSLGSNLLATFSRLIPYYFEVVFLYWISSIFIKMIPRPLFKDNN